MAPAAPPPAAAGIFLAGFMGCGKSTIGPLLGGRLGWPFVDLDTEIERRAGRSIPEIFAQEGEAAFRDREHEALREQAELGLAGQPRVVALGGGAFAYARNRGLLNEVGVTVWLDADADTLWNRVRLEAHRPLARDRAAFETLLASRREAYALADGRVDATASPDEVVRRVFELGWVRKIADA